MPFSVFNNVKAEVVARSRTSVDRAYKHLNISKLLGILRRRTVLDNEILARLFGLSLLICQHASFFASFYTGSGKGDVAQVIAELNAAK